MLCATVMRDNCLFVPRLEGIELPSELAERGFGVTYAKGAGFFERAEG